MQQFVSQKSPPPCRLDLGSAAVNEQFDTRDVLSSSVAELELSSSDASRSIT